MEPRGTGSCTRARRTAGAAIAPSPASEAVGRGHGRPSYSQARKEGEEKSARADRALPVKVRGTMASPAELREVARYRVIYGDTDQMGLVYYGNYLRYFEIARNEFLRLAGARYRAFEETHRLMLPVVEAHVRYRRPARYDDELAIYAAIAGGARRVRALRLRDPAPARRRVAGRRAHRARVHRRAKAGSRAFPTELRAALGQSRVTQPRYARSATARRTAAAGFEHAERERLRQVELDRLRGRARRSRSTDPGRRSARSRRRAPTAARRLRSAAARTSGPSSTCSVSRFASG